MRLIFDGSTFTEQIRGRRRRRRRRRKKRVYADLRYQMKIYEWMTRHKMCDNKLSLFICLHCTLSKCSWLWWIMAATMHPLVETDSFRIRRKLWNSEKIMIKLTYYRILISLIYVRLSFTHSAIDGFTKQSTKLYISFCIQYCGFVTWNHKIHATTTNLDDRLIGASNIINLGYDGGCVCVFLRSPSLHSFIKTKLV